MQFDYERLDIYGAAADFGASAYKLSRTFGRGHGELGDQLRRAALSVVLNLSEGAGEFSPNEKARFYRLARRSATECAAILDICARADVVDRETAQQHRACLVRIVSMLLIRASEVPR